VELFHQLFGVGNMFRRLPGGRFGIILIPHPLDKVLELPAPEPGVQDGGDFVFRVSIDFHRKRRRMGAIGDGIGSVGL